MAYDGWIEFDGKELVNLSRTVQLAETLGIDLAWDEASDVAWVQTALGGVNYHVVSAAPWYDAGHPASAEFAGFVPLSFAGLDDSTLESTPTEYTGEGGHSGKARHTTLPIVASLAIIASTDRGADFGKRWLDRMLGASGDRTFCVGSDLRYFQYKGTGLNPPKVHRRDVKQTRGTSVTRKRVTDCSAMWLVTFTLTAADPYEYGEPVSLLAALGSGAPVGASSSGLVPLALTGCPQFDYSPIYDPLYPALVPVPSAPDFYPAGWTITPGLGFRRYWARIPAVEPSALRVVPMLTLTTAVDARMVRVGVWASDSPVDDQCGPLFSSVVTYLPAGQQFIIDGEQKASYVWNGISPSVRRTDSLVYGPDAEPVEWAAFNDPSSYLVTLDLFANAGQASGYEGNDTVRLSLSMVPKSD